MFLGDVQGLGSFILVKKITLVVVDRLILLLFVHPVHPELAFEVC
jgi:hypothetical protein